ncbi:MAG TPA: ABC transporter ATP-binding protein [Rhizobiaceae bacterium]|nr:ABC transporter ATP-binding protein [Rhizobiaceae bacterium]
MSGVADRSPAPSATEIVRVHDLSVELPTGISTSVKAVRNAHLVVRKGQRVGIVGESGSGKSVTGRTIAGLLPESRRVAVNGSVQILGKEMIGATNREWLKVRREIVSMIFQDPLSFLNPTMTVGRQVAEAVAAGGAQAANKHEAAIEFLRLAGLSDPEKYARSYPFELSGGMRQRVLIAIALAKRPALIIADEPTTALDVTVQARVLATLDESVSKLQTALILISHDLAVVAKLCDYIYVMYRGEVVEAGPTLDIFTRPNHAYTRDLLAGVRSLTSPDHQLSGFRPMVEG